MRQLRALIGKKEKRPETKTEADMFACDSHIDPVSTKRADVPTLSEFQSNISRIRD